MDTGTSGRCQQTSTFCFSKHYQKFPASATQGSTFVRHLSKKSKASLWPAPRSKQLACPSLPRDLLLSLPCMAGTSKFPISEVSPGLRNPGYLSLTSLLQLLVHLVSFLAIGFKPAQLWQGIRQLSSLLTVPCNPAIFLLHICGHMKF